MKLKLFFVSAIFALLLVNCESNPKKNVSTSDNTSNVADYNTFELSCARFGIAMDSQAVVLSPKEKALVIDTTLSWLFKERTLNYQALLTFLKKEEEHSKKWHCFRGIAHLLYYFNSEEEQLQLIQLVKNNPKMGVRLLQYTSRFLSKTHYPDFWRNFCSENRERCDY